MPNSWACTVRGRFPGLNEYIGHERSPRVGRFRASRMKKESTERVYYAAYQTHPVQRPLFPGKVRITIHWYERDRRRDIDNIRFAAKFVLDGLVMAEIIPDDSQKYVVGISDVFDVDKGNPRVVVTVEEAM